jgi:urease accessory protein
MSRRARDEPAGRGGTAGGQGPAAESSALLELLLSDGRFPGGGFAHSGGLEPAAADGSVRDVPSLEAFVTGRLLTVGLVDAWCAAAACRVAPDVDALRGLEEEAQAHQPVPALRTASRAQGRGLRAAAAVLWPAVGTCAAEVHSVVLGAVAAAAGLTPAAAARAAAHACVMGPCSAAPKLWAVDTVDALAVAVRLAPLAARVVADALAAPTCPVRSAPRLEQRADAHARAEARLFAS